MWDSWQECARNVRIYAMLTAYAVINWNLDANAALITMLSSIYMHSPIPSLLEPIKINRRFSVIYECINLVSWAECMHDSSWICMYCGICVMRQFIAIDWNLWHAYFGHIYVLIYYVQRVPWTHKKKKVMYVRVYRYWPQDSSFHFTHQYIESTSSAHKI